MRRTVLLAAAAAMATALIAPPASASTDPIQPGDYMASSVGACTLNFVFLRGGNTYIGTAAHCVNAMGEDIRTITGEVFGDVAWIGDENSTAWDFALIQVRAAHVNRVRGAVKGYPGYPNGHTIWQDTTLGDLIQVSGYGTGYSLTTATQEKRVAVMGGDGDQIHGVSGPIHWGDSGGPLVHIKTAKAMGIVSRLCVGTVCTETGPTVQGMLDKLAASGFAVTLRNAP